MSGDGVEIDLSEQLREAFSDDVEEVAERMRGFFPTRRERFALEIFTRCQGLQGCKDAHRLAVEAADKLLLELEASALKAELHDQQRTGER